MNWPILSLFIVPRLNLNQENEIIFGLNDKHFNVLWVAQAGYEETPGNCIELYDSFS